jgi:thioredoxin-related protein
MNLFCTVKRFLIYLLGLFGISSPGYSQFEKSETHAFPGIANWEEVVAKATLDNKNIMIDLSTEWCYWCKVMDKQIFRDAEVLSLMNPKLNSYILDAEKDSIGKLMKLKYGIASYPSFIFFTPQGEYLETWHGSMPKIYWMNFIKDSIDKVALSRPGIPNGLIFDWPTFVQKEVNSNFKKSTPSSQELIQFFNQCDYKKFTDFNVCRFYPNDVPAKLLDIIIKDQPWLNTQYGPDITNNMIETSLNWKGYRQIEDKNWANARKYINRYKLKFPENHWEVFNLNLYYFETKNEVDSIIELGIQNDSFVYDYTSDQLSEFIVKNGNQKSQFKQAAFWNSREISKGPNFKRAKLQAQISAKLDDWDEAKHWAGIAVEEAKKENLELEIEDQQAFSKILDLK